MPDAGTVAASQTLADQALENLVNQFARPLDFLRELVQNSIDAGSPRVEVWLAFAPPAHPGEPRGVLEIHIDDSGEGMDEHLIDSQLTKMFSSTKEGDLTKIGKFGIGFTSIFAIRPDAVLLRTGKHGESWELLFHPDRSFDKVKVDIPVAGTRITLFKRMAAGEVDRFVRECRWVLQHWCEHSNTPITFWDRTQQQAAPQAAPADPFAAFATGPSAAQEASPAAGPERISGPMELRAELVETLDSEGVHAVVGYADEPRFGFYNGGLTLLSTRNTDALGSHAARLGHLAFKVKSDKLEHTLTRDNVLQDEHWETAMGVLLRAADALRARLLERLDQVDPSQPDALDPVLGWVAAECRASRLARERGFGRRLRLPTAAGGAVTLDEVEAQEDDVGAILLEPRGEGLQAALAAEGLHLLCDRPAIRAVLEATTRPPLLSFLHVPRRLVAADDLFIEPELIPDSALPPVERDLMKRVSLALEAATRRRVTVRVGSFGGALAGGAEALALEGPIEGGLFQRPRATWFRLPAFLRRRCLLINRHHPAFRAQVVAAAEDPLLAAYALSQAILHVEDVEGDGTWQTLTRVMADKLVQQAPALEEGA